ncbi:MAG: hypothetical protein L0213_05445 [Candidatus Dadabacteria bacterium]|nr:hypothetical protein [Candidatus Dadabacteria bacterium]
MTEYIRSFGLVVRFGPSLGKEIHESTLRGAAFQQAHLHDPQERLPAAINPIIAPGLS